KAPRRWRQAAGAAATEPCRDEFDRRRGANFGRFAVLGAASRSRFESHQHHRGGGAVAVRVAARWAIAGAPTWGDTARRRDARAGAGAVFRDELPGHGNERLAATRSASVARPRETMNRFENLTGGRHALLDR